MRKREGSHLARMIGTALMALVLIVSGGCSSASKTPPPEPTFQPILTQLPSTQTPVLLAQDSSERVNLQIGDSHVSLMLVQGGSVIPVTIVNSRRGVALLAPDSFDIQVEGNREATSITALTPEDKSLLLALEQSGRPLVTFAGTGNAHENHNLRMFHPSLEFDDDPESFFIEWWGSTPEQAAELSHNLESELGVTPIVLFSAHSFLDDRHHESSFTIETINGIRPTETETILIVVFLENWLGGYLGMFSQMEWFTFQISFAKE